MGHFIARRWTADDVATLKGMAQKSPTTQIATQLGRAPSAVTYKAHKLRISLRVGGNTTRPVDGLEAGAESWHTD
jgi:hypothetical protein